MHQKPICFVIQSYAPCVMCVVHARQVKHKGRECNEKEREIVKSLGRSFVRIQTRFGSAEVCWM